jgi:hypothetical protein
VKFIAYVGNKFCIEPATTIAIASEKKKSLQIEMIKHSLMMKHILLISLILGLIGNCKKNFSSFQGTMKWKEAKEKCESLSMRLPTRVDFKKAVEDKITESWKSDGWFYWTSDELDNESAFPFFIGLGIMPPIKKKSTRHIRCIR